MASLTKTRAMLGDRILTIRVLSDTYHSAVRIDDYADSIEL